MASTRRRSKKKFLAPGGTSATVESKRAAPKPKAVAVQAETSTTIAAPKHEPMAEVTPPALLLQIKVAEPEVKIVDRTVGLTKEPSVTLAPAPAPSVAAESVPASPEAVSTEATHETPAKLTAIQAVQLEITPLPVTQPTPEPAPSETEAPQHIAVMLRAAEALPLLPEITTALPIVPAEESPATEVAAIQPALPAEDFVRQLLAPEAAVAPSHAELILPQIPDSATDESQPAALMATHTPEAAEQIPPSVVVAVAEALVALPQPEKTAIAPLLTAITDAAAMLHEAIQTADPADIAHAQTALETACAELLTRLSIDYADDDLHVFVHRAAGIQPPQAIAEQRAFTRYEQGTHEFKRDSLPARLLAYLAQHVPPHITLGSFALHSVQSQPAAAQEVNWLAGHGLRPHAAHTV